MATHSSILTWKIPGTRGTWWATVHRVAKSRTRLSTHSIHCVIRQFTGDTESVGYTHNSYLQTHTGIETHPHIDKQCSICIFVHPIYSEYVYIGYMCIYIQCIYIYVAVYLSINLLQRIGLCDWLAKRVQKSVGQEVGMGILSSG